MKAGTAWEAGRLRTVGSSKRVLFGEMYEDAEIEVEAFGGNGRIFSIASAGSTAMRLARQHSVVACDINPVQLAYARRRAYGGRREMGDADKAMSFARMLMPLVGWRREMVREFLLLSDCEQQELYWRMYLDTRRFRAGFNLLMSRFALRMVYAPDFLSFLPSHLGSIMRQRWMRGFATHANATNPYAWRLLLGEELDDGIWREANVADRMDFVSADAASYLEGCEPGSFDGFALSNILDGATPAYRLRLSHAVARAGGKGAVATIRSFAEPTSHATSNLACHDRSLLWGVVEARPANSLCD